MSDWGVCKDCAIKDNCSHYKPCKRQCEDYEREPQTNFEQITKDEESLAEWLAELLDNDVCSPSNWNCKKCFKWCHRDKVVAWLKQPLTEE